MTAEYLTEEEKLRQECEALDKEVERLRECLNGFAIIAGAVANNGGHGAQALRCCVRAARVLVPEEDTDA